MVRGFNCILTNLVIFVLPTAGKSPIMPGWTLSSLSSISSSSLFCAVFGAHLRGNVQFWVLKSMLLLRVFITADGWLIPNDLLNHYITWWWIWGAGSVLLRCAIWIFRLLSHGIALLLYMTQAPHPLMFHICTWCFKSLRTSFRLMFFYFRNWKSRIFFLFFYFLSRLSVS